MALVARELLKHRQLIGLLKAAQAHAHRTGLGSNHHDGAVRPVRRCDRSDTVADAGPVLADDNTMPARCPGVTVGHVRSALLMDHRNQSNTGRCKDVHRIHKSRAHDAENIGDAVGHHGFDKGFRRRHFLDAGDNAALVGNGLGQWSIHRWTPKCLSDRPFLAEAKYRMPPSRRQPPFQKMRR